MKIFRYTAATLAGFGLAKVLSRGSRPGSGRPSARIRGSSGEHIREECLQAPGEFPRRSQPGPQVKPRESDLHQFADAMPQIAFTAEPDGYVDFFNKKWFEYSGFSEEQTYAKDGWAAILHPDDVGVIRKWYALVRAGEPYEAEERYADRSAGGYRWFLRRALPVKDENGKVIRWFGTSTDITEQKQKQLSLAEAREELRRHASELEEQVSERTGELHESMESMERVLYHVAHDLRAPLRAMHGFTAILLRQCSGMLDKEGVEFGNRISEAAMRMDNLIQDLLTYGHLAQPGIPREEIDLEHEVRTALNLLQSQIQSTNAEVSVDGPMPPVVANGTLLGEVIMNLISNALKFVSPATRPRVHIWAEPHDGMVRLSVQDNGIGIAPQHQDKIFGMFQRLHDHRTYPGTGIGLAIVAKGLQRMGGRFGLESQLGHGSRFWFELPEGRGERETLRR